MIRALSAARHHAALIAAGVLCALLGAGAITVRASAGPTPCQLLSNPLLPPPSGSTPCPLVSLGPPTGAPATARPSAASTVGAGLGAGPGSGATPSPTGAGAAAGDAVNAGGFLDILGLVTAPANVGVEQPSLHHFSLAVSSLPGGPAPSGGQGHALTAGPGAGVATWPIALAALALALAAAALVRPPAGLRRRRRLALLAPAPVAGLVLVVALSAQARAPAPSRADAAVVLRSAGPLPKHLASAGELLLSHLAGLEASVAAKRVQAQTLATLAGQTRLDDASLAPPRGHSVASSPGTGSDAAVAAYQSSLQSEYQFFTSTVADGAARDALVGAVRSAPPAVRDAVTYDVAAIDAVLAQEAAISAAQQAAPDAGGVATVTLQAPLSGAVTQGFGPTDLVFEPPLSFGGVTYPHFHTGVDLAAPLDTPVHAAADGVVVLAGASTDALGRLVGYGNYVVISHAGRMITLYGHLDSIGVHSGQAVRAGDTIGSEGSSGYSTGPHLHFEVRVAGAVTDPLPYLGSQLSR